MYVIVKLSLHAASDSFLLNIRKTIIYFLQEAYRTQRHVFCIVVNYFREENFCLLAQDTSLNEICLSKFQILKYAIRRVCSNLHPVKWHRFRQS